VFVVIAGGGRTAAQLAAFLLEHGHTVKLVEHRRDVLAHIHRELPTEAIYEGHATEPAVLEAVGVGHAQVLAACMASDAENLALCFMARSRYSVQRTVAIINNPRNAWLFDKNFHVDVSLSQADILASLIEQEMSVGEMLTLLKLRRGRYSLVEDSIPEGAPAVGQTLQELPLPPNCVIAAIIRQGEIVIPRGPVRLAAGDEVLAIVAAESSDELAALFGHRRKAP
jgi:trk system potassium uptake protein TrkA